jgi:hypothetical protein
MATTTVLVTAKARKLAQDAGPGNTATGVQLLLTDPGDYDEAVAQAVRIYSQDRQNRRVVNVTAPSAGFRLVVGGTGALAGLTGLDAWADGESALLEVYRQWAVTKQNQQPMDVNTWRLVRDPGDVIVLELLEESVAAGEVVRLVFTAPHALTASAVTSTVPDAHEAALAMLGASLILQLAANKAVQNTGNTGLPNDVVDRRSQSDMFRSRAKELRDGYNTLIGKGAKGDLQPASAVGDLDVSGALPWGLLWHSRGSR